MTKIKYFAVTLVLLLGMGSCSQDFLEMEPLTDRVEGNFYKTEKDALRHWFLYMMFSSGSRATVIILGI
ncbi:MAG TPA: hypothetical protein PKO42_05730 [Tenuifilaceae bacterium]|nr:hypothetical protein [Tenuifilaceae bacterium]